MALTEAKDIQINIVPVILVCGNMGMGVYFFTKRDTNIDGKIESVSEAVKRIENNQKQDQVENKIWQGKLEAELADLKLRTALLEARVFTNKK